MTTTISQLWDLLEILCFCEDLKAIVLPHPDDNNNKEEDEQEEQENDNNMEETTTRRMTTKNKMAITWPIFKLGPPDFAWQQIQRIPADDDDDDNDDHDNDDEKPKWP